MPTASVRALFVVPVRFLQLWQVGVLSAALAHERNHPALALLVLAPANHLLFHLINSLHPLATAVPLSAQELHNVRELTGFTPLRLASKAWLGRFALIATILALASRGLLSLYGSLDQLRADTRVWMDTTHWWLVLGALVLFTFFLYGPLWLAFKRFAQASGLSDSRPWRALLVGMGIWLWVDSLFVAIFQQIALNCVRNAVALCGTGSSFTQDITHFADAFYFSTMTLATVGYGDISPVVQVARVLVTSEVVIGIGLLGFILGRVAGFATQHT